MKMFVSECLNILNFLFIRVFVKIYMDMHFKRGDEKNSNYKAFKTERL